jgi:hypothetical protein
VDGFDVHLDALHTAARTLRHTAEDTSTTLERAPDRVDAGRSTHLLDQALSALLLIGDHLSAEADRYGDALVESAARYHDTDQCHADPLRLDLPADTAPVPGASGPMTNPPWLTTLQSPRPPFTAFPPSRGGSP